MKTALQFLNKPAVLALFVLAGCLFMLHSVSTRFFDRVRSEREDLVASLRQAQTPEPEIAAISKAFDRVTSDSGNMAISFFAFTSVVLVCGFTVRSGKPLHDEIQQPQHRELKPDHVC